MARPKKRTVRLSNEELKHLKKLLKSKGTSNIILNRCRILIALDENHLPAKTYDQCVADHNVSRATIANTVKLYVDNGLDTVLTINRNVNSDNSRRKVDGRVEAKIIQIACGPVPDGHSRWTIRLLEKQMKIELDELDEPISREAIRRTLKKIGLDLTAATAGVSQTNVTQNL